MQHCLPSDQWTKKDTLVAQHTLHFVVMLQERTVNSSAAATVISV